MVRVKCNGSLIDGNFTIEEGEIKELPEDWELRLGIVSNIQRGFLILLDKSEAEKKVDEFKETPKQNDEKEPVNLTRGTKGIRKVNLEGKITHIEKDTLDKKDAENLLNQNAATVLSKLKKTRLSINDLILLQRTEKKKRKRNGILAEIEILLK